MNADQRRKLAAAGWRVGDAKDFLELTPDEAELVEIELDLVRVLDKRPEKHN